MRLSLGYRANPHDDDDGKFLQAGSAGASCAALVPTASRTRRNEVETSSKKKSFFPYLVVATGIACCIGPSAMAFSCAGIFYTPVSETLGVGKGVLAIYMTVLCLSMTITLPFAGKLMETKDIRVLLSTAVALVGGSLIAMSFFNQVWQFYITGALIGVGEAFLLYLAVPTLINRWFKKRVGFFIGLCMAFTGIGGVIFNPIGGAFIASGPEGWRMGYLVFGIVALVVALPFTLFCVRSYPSDKGLQPVGADEVTSEGAAPAAALTGVSAKVAMRSTVFYMMAIFAGLINLCTVIYQFLPSYATSLGDQLPEIAALSATLASAAMLGQAIGKVALGAINDRSVYGGLAVGLGSGVIGLVLMWLIPGSVPVMLAGGFLFGIFYASATVQVPLMTRTIFGTREYSNIYSRVSMVASLCSAFAATLWGFLIDATGYSYMFIIGIVAVVLIGFGGYYALKAGRKLEHTTE
ncbi:MFS transporter [Eggerthella lenta]|uniref:MFS transporter n=1 Tax=Eggerthella lenta TaxID=84112 RepID=A0A369MCB8_EGGLN|nr:MFS transporter [Eggerthella lenta]